MAVHDPDRIRLQHYAAPVRVYADDIPIADTRRAIELDETGYPPRLYIPREDIVDDRLAVAEKRTHCPFKGDATYYHVRLEGETCADAAWSYEQPFAAMRPIAGHLAFDHPRLTVATTLV